MAIIYTYPAIGTPEDPDIMLISDVSLASNATRNITLSNLSAFVNAKVNLSTAGDAGTGIVNLSTQILSVIGTANQIETSAVDQTIQIGLPSDVVVPGTLNVVGAATFRSNVTMNIGLGVQDFLIADGDVRLLGPTPFSTNELAVNGNTILKGETRFFGKLLDTAAGVPGSDGAILTSTGTGVSWKDPSAIPGNVHGQGTNLTIPMWNGATPTSKLADSTIKLRLVSPGAANPYSLQFGGNSQATGVRNSVAIGYNTSATAESTLATGHETKAQGLHSASFNFDTTAIGNKSAAFGNKTKASGSSSFSLGSGTIAATSLSFAGGLNSVANPSLNGTTAFAYGNALNIAGEDAAGFGKGNTATGKRNFVVGSNNQVAGDNSFSIGANNIITAGGATTIGSGNNISTFGSIAIGQNNALNNSIQTAAFGYNLTAGGKQYQTIVGYSNAVNNDADFIVGTGIIPSSPKNGLEVYRDKVVIPEYGSGNVPGTPAYNLQVDATGKIIESLPVIGNFPKKLVQIITQTGTTAPTILTNLENTLTYAPGGFIGWTYVSGGEYNLEITGAFDLIKTIVFINGGSAENNHDVAWEVIDANNLRIRTHNSNDKLTKAAIEIRTYN